MQQQIKFISFVWLLVTAVTLAACTTPEATAVPTPTQLVSPTPMATATTAPAYPADAYTVVVNPPSPSAAYPGAETAANIGDIPVYTYEVVAQFPHDAEAFTQGLVWLDGEFYEGTGLYGRSSLRRVNPETGEVQQSIDLADTYFGEGIVLWEDKIIQITWQEQTAFVYDQETFAQVGEFAYPTEGWGITHDGRQLIMSDGSNTLYFRDPGTFAEIGQVQVFDGEVPITRLNELEYIDGEVWANIWQTDRIARINPETGLVTGWVDLTGLRPAEATDGNAVLNGIAYDAANGRLFVTGKLWPTLFEIEVVPADS